jgi:hypothetical protein
MPEIKTKRYYDGGMVFAIHGRPWTTTIRKMAELKAEELRGYGYNAKPGDKYPFVVYIIT